MVGNEQRKDPDVDGGYAWVILVGCFFMYMLVVGTIKSYGVLYTEMLSYFQSGAGNTAWIGSLCFLLMLGMGPFVNWLGVRFTFRKVAFIGGILLGTGFTASAFVPRMEYLFITFGLFGGLGFGLSFSPCSTIISFYFEKRRALANGITVSASGIGAFCFPFLYQYLFEQYSLRGTLWITGGIVLNICVAALFFVQPRALRLMKRMEKKKQKHNTSDGKGLLNGDTSIQDDPKNSEQKKTECCKGINLNFKLFKNPRFTLLAIAFTLCMNGYGNNLILIPSHVKALGYGQTEIVLSVSIMGGCEVISRIFFGWVADKKLIKHKYIFLMSMFVAAVSAFIAPQFDSFIFMAIYSAIIGIFPGSFWSLISVLIIDVVGMANFPSAFGLISLCLALGSVFSQPTIGWLSDSTGSWHASFYLSGVLLLLSGAVILLEPLIVHTKPESEGKEEEPEPEEMKPIYSLRQRTSPRPSSHDTGSLLDDDNVNDVSFTSFRISKIYKPIEKEMAPESPKRTSAPLANPSEV